MDAGQSPHVSIDTHAHVFTRTLLRGTRMEGVFDADYGFDRYVRALTDAQLTYGVIAAATFLGTQWNYTLDALAAHGNLKATVIVDPTINAPELRRLDDAGVVGIRIGTGNTDHSPNLRDTQYARLFARLAEMGWHVHLYGKPAHMPSLLDALTHTGVHVVVDHFGLRGNDPTENNIAFSAVLRALETGRTWVKLSGAYLSDQADHAALTKALLAKGAQKRLLWGSDWPFVHLNGQHSIAETLKAFASWVPDRTLQCQIDENARDLYGFDPA